MTAFLERFFERYVSYDYTAELEEELDDVSGGRLGWQKLLEAFWRDFKPKAGEVMEQKPSEVTAALDEFLAPWLFPDKDDGSDPRLCPACGNGPAGAARRQVRRVRRLLQLSRVQIYPAVRPGRRRGARATARPSSATASALKTGRFGPYVELGEGKDAKRASIPKDVPADGLTLEMAEQLLSLPREIGAASRDRQADHRVDRPLRAVSGPRRQICAAGLDRRSVRDRHERGGRQARRGGGGDGQARRRRASRSRCSARIPTSGKEIKVMGAATAPMSPTARPTRPCPRRADPKAVTLDEAVALIDAKAAKGPSKKQAGAKEEEVIRIALTACRMAKACRCRPTRATARLAWMWSPPRM